MNKLKLLYDVVKVLKNKEAFNGNLTVQVHKDDTQLFSLENEFEKNLVTRQTKAKITTQLDYAGKTVKHESNTEFTLSGPGGCRHHEFFRRLHQSQAGGCEGLKGKLSRLSCALSVLMALQTKELEDKTVVLSLSAGDLSEDTQAHLREKMSQAGACHQHCHGLLTEFCQAPDLDFVIEMFINKRNEAEKVVLTLAGTPQDEHNVPHDLTARVELSLVW